MFTKIKLAIPTYYVGTTVSGSLPDTDPVAFNSICAAKDHLVTVISDYIDRMSLEQHRKLGRAGKLLRDFISTNPQECNVPVGDIVFWITKE